MNPAGVDPIVAGPTLIVASMDETKRRSADEIEREIAAAREDLARTVRELEQSVRRRFDWRWTVRERPLTWLGVAFVLGLWLGRR